MAAGAAILRIRATPGPCTRCPRLARRDHGARPQYHDLVFRATLSDVRRAQAILKAHLEPWLAALVADEPPVPLDGTFVDEELRGSQSDKLFQVTLKGGEPGFVHVLLEHKSSPDPGTALQVFKYKVRIWEAYAQGSRDRLRALPTIIPLVFYHGSKPWTAPGSVAEMLATADKRLRALEPSFGYYLRDLGHIPIERLAPDPAARDGLVVLRYSHKGGEAEKMRVLPQVLAALPDGSEFDEQVLLSAMAKAAHGRGVDGMRGGSRSVTPEGAAA
ncbi:MAG: Rpn family recombination-promoting nuclease/putative transposase [Bryobacterales bacterium]|nr:Rpn family recombination-promoting nuclease/putative transposase [Bryobacterales bacterium]